MDGVIITLKRHHIMFLLNALFSSVFTALSIVNNFADFIKRTLIGDY